MFSGDSVKFHLDLTALNSTRIDELTMIIFSEFGARVAILDFRDFGIAGTQIAEGPFVVSGEVRSLPLIEGTYRAGLWAVTNSFRGEILDVAQFEIIGRRDAGAVRYPSMYRGVIELDFEMSAAPARIPAPSAQ